jgi:drug/metabolite transporter (DMT)-like permease
VSFRGLPPTTLTVGQHLSAGLLLLPLIPVEPPSGTVTLEVALATLALGLLSTGVAYLIYFRLLARVGPTNTLSVTFLNPFFGMLWGALFLNEQITPVQLLGFGVILVGLMLVTGVQFARAREPLAAQG